MPPYGQQAYYTGQTRTSEPHRQSQQNNHRQYNSKNFDHPKQRQFNQPWTSTPRDRNSRYNSPKSQTWFGDNSANNTLVNLLDTQCKVQQETTQALSTIIKLQDTRANDAFLTDLHSFNGKPDEFLKWIAAIERVANVTGRPARELATAKAEGAVFKCLQGIPHSMDWEGCKKILRESFSNIQTKEHANSFLMGRSQRPSESLQEYIHVFSELAKITTGLEPKQITESMMITLFNRHLYNHHIKKQVCKRTHRTLQCAFDSAMKAEADAKKLEGLSENNVSIMKIETSAEINQMRSDNRANPNTKGDTSRKQSNYPRYQTRGPCYQCSEYGHIAKECPNSKSHKQSTNVQPSTLDCTNQNHLLTSTQPPRVTQTITTESQLSTVMWNNLLTQLNEVKNENHQMKRFVKKHLPNFKGKPKDSTPDRTTKSGTQGTTKSAQQQTSNYTTKVNKVGVDLEDLQEEVLPSFLLDLLQENSEEKVDELIEPSTPCDTDYSANINVVLFSNATMASEFPIGIGKQKNTGLFDSGASHSCISYECYKESIPHVTISEAAHISVENASGESMGPLGVCEATISLGNKNFTHHFIVCKNLTSSLVLGLDFSSHFRIGTDWTSDGRMYLHQGKKKLIEGTVNAVAAERPRLVTKIQVNLPPRTIGIVPVQVSQKDYIKADKIYESVPDLSFESQYPVATIPLIHCNNKEQDLVACIVNPTEWTIPIHADKTIQEIRPVSAKVKLNKLLVTDNKSDVLPTPLETSAKEIVSGTIMPGDFSPHQKLNLEDYTVKPETRKKLEHLIAKYDSIISKDTNDIDTTPLIMMEIETEGPPVASRPYVLSLKHQEFVRKEVAKLAAAGTIRRSLSRYASPVVVVPKKAPPDAPIEDKHRMAIDYRHLNKQMPFVKSVDSNKKGAVSLIPLPKIDQLFARLNGAVIFSAIDIRQGYHHIALSEDAIPKTAFSLETGEKWEFLKVPFGLSQAPAYFMALINKVLEGCEVFALGYMDDILIYSPDEETHLIHIEAIFIRLQEAKLKLKLSKCSFFKKHLHYLGHLISSDGLLPTVEKTAAIKDLAQPKNVHEVQVVMGMFNYYRKFIPNFAEIAKSIVELTKKNVKFDWTEKCQLAFDTLKSCLTEGPILVYPNPSKDYHLFTDASKDTWSAILMQDQNTVSSDCLDLRPVAYQSGTFKGSQLNWATLTKEAYAIYMAFRKFSFYLDGALTNL